MPKNLTIAAAALLAVAGAACTRGRPADSPLPTPASSSPAGVTGTTGTTIVPSGSLPPSSSPGITGSVTTGTATVAVSGAATASVTFGTLGAPAIWAPPPGTMALQWNGPGDQTLGVGGTAVLGQRPTSTSLSLSFTVKLGTTDVGFRSTAGECIVTINTVADRSVAGLFQCTGVKNSDGTIVVNAQGSFGATG